MPGRFSNDVEDLISSFRGLPGDPLPLRNAGAKPLDGLIESIVERYRIGRNTPEEAIQENWPRIVGPEFAKRCRPERIDPSGALVIQVPNAIVRRELNFMEDRIMTAIASITECENITRIVLKAGP